jgi:hypothetical protein
MPSAKFEVLASTSMSLSIDTTIVEGMSNDFYASILARQSVQFPLNGSVKA